LGAAVLLIAACSTKAADRARDTVALSPPPAPAAGGAPVAFRALGTEPFWGLEIDSTGLRFRTPENQEGTLFPPVAATRLGDTLRWAGGTGGVTIDARIWPARCSDGMSDRAWDQAALVVMKGETYRGCAERR
jgi:uncharacterized membrane protein